MSKIIHAADLFCGAGGTSLGVVRALEKLGYQVKLTAINHWTTAIATHTENHPARFGLVRPVVKIQGKRYLLDIRFRMLQPHELAQAQGFPRDYIFTGTKTDQVKQIGNAVPCGLAEAIVMAVLTQNPVLPAEKAAA